MIDYDTPLREVVGDRTAKALATAFDLHTVDDALRNYPRRYVRRGELTRFTDLREGEDVTILALVAKVSSRVATRKVGRRPTIVTEIELTDRTNRLTATFFNQPWREKALQPGLSVLASGTVKSFRHTWQLVHPDYEILPQAGPKADLVLDYAGVLIPIYPASAKVPSWRVADAIELVLSGVDELADPLPPKVRAEAGVLGFADAMRAIHQPTDAAHAAAGERRLRWEEAFVLQTELLRRRAARRARSAVPRQPRPDGLVAALDAALPFELTAGQRAVGAEIAADMAQAHPMLRLLQGDVGSGKTLVALRAMLACVDAGAQAALLAPTEVLAAQHYATVLKLLGPLARRGELFGDSRGTSVVLLTGSLGARAKREAMLAAASGQAGIVIGTHALMSDRMAFAELGLVVVDEQHRFGVEQRAALAAGERDLVPHTLVMTATPIPRTAAMTVFGDLDVSTLAERPAGRSPVTTHVVPALDRPTYLSRVFERITEEVEAGHQVFVVCPRITADDAGEPSPRGYPPNAVVELVAYLAAGPLANLRVGAMHSRLPTDQKDAVMADFAAGDLDVLVSTTVIEVGVDVPNATLMVIIDADRFGVSTLHQLRGRVGRGSSPGLCLLVTSAALDSAAVERLSALAATDDGFKVSMIDLRTRREGDVLGAAQSGRFNSLRLLSVLDHADLIGQARAAAADLLESDPELEGHPELSAALDRLSRSTAGDFLDKA